MASEELQEVDQDEVQAVVVGAGAAGLGAALALSARGAEVLLVEQGDRLGGVMRSERSQGFLFERGPNTMRVSAPALEVIQRAGLEAGLLRAAPASRHRYLLRGDGLVRVPMDPVAFVTSSLLSGKGKRRILGEPFVARGDARGESVAEFMARRLGPETLERLVGPFLLGVYAGDERRLGAEAVFPSLVAFERQRGSIALGALWSALRGGASGLAGSHSAREGMGGFAELLAREVRGRIELGTRVEGLAPRGQGWTLTLSSAQGERELRARSVVLATEAPAAAALLTPLDAEAGRIVASVAYAPIASLALSVDPAAAAGPIEGFGFLVPRDQGLDLLGALFMSRLFQGRAPPERELITALLGGTGWPGVVDADDDALLKRAVEGLERGLGLGSAEIVGVSRWPQAVPQPGPDHPRKVAALRRCLAAFPGLAVAGCYLDGVGVADTLACGARAGQELRIA